MDSSHRDEDQGRQQAGGLVRALVSVPDKFEDGD